MSLIPIWRELDSPIVLGHLLGDDGVLTGVASSCPGGLGEPPKETCGKSLHVERRYIASWSPVLANAACAYGLCDAFRLRVFLEVSTGSVKCDHAIARSVELHMDA